MATKNKKKKKAADKSIGKYKNLVIVESPAKARTINKFLGSDFHVESSMGHIRDLPKSRMGVDLENDFDPEYIIIRKSIKNVNRLKAHAKKKVAIYIAPDPDREGEAIGWHLAHIFREAKSDAKIHRVEFHEITREAVQKAFQNPRTIDMNLVNAQQARRVLDRIVGYQLSPLLWKKVGRGLSAGRVQSIALRLIVDREHEIKKFVPVEYWTIDVKLSSLEEKYKNKIFSAKLEKIDKEKVELTNGEQTEKIRKEISNLPFTVSKIEKKERKRKSQAPYTTSKLQQEAYNRLGFSAAKTMSVAQRLYEGMDVGEEGSIGLITYMRTDSVNIATSAKDEAGRYIKEAYGDKYLPKTPNIYKSRKGAQEAHEAIRPTSAFRSPAKMINFLDKDQLKLYALIWRKFLASQMTPAIDEHVSILINAGEKYSFKTTGRRNIFPGFLAALSDVKETKEDARDGQKEKENNSDGEDIPPLKEGENLELHELFGNQHFTKPPARFNDASLVKTLEEKGIGRPSTYAPTISTILGREYAERRGGALVPTELGEIVVKLLLEHFPTIMEYKFTATMEGNLDEIEEGKIEWKKVLRDFYAPFSKHVDLAKEEMKNVKKEAMPTSYKCEKCGKPMVIKWGRYGKFMACSGFPDCKETRAVSTGVKCPQSGCDGELVKRRGQGGRYFYGCLNYPKCTYVTNKLPQEEKDVPSDLSK